MRVALCIPMFNPGDYAAQLASAIAMQSRSPDEILIIDSSPNDGGPAPFDALGAQVMRIRSRDFDHGATRNLALSRVSADFYLFLTQDAIPSDRDSFANLIRTIQQNPHVGVAYGRQLAREGAGLLAAHHRLFNYPEASSFMTLDSAHNAGVRAAFCSNSFAVYRRDALQSIGGFPDRVIFGEDTYAAARMLQNGWAVAYDADARVWHSHEYSLGEEAARYFDHGVFHSTERWYIELLGGTSKEGARLLRSQIQYLRSQRAWAAIPRVLTVDVIRWLSYRLGRGYRVLPRRIVLGLSSNKAYWHRNGPRRM